MYSSPSWLILPRLSYVYLETVMTVFLSVPNYSSMSTPLICQQMFSIRPTQCHSFLALNRYWCCCFLTQTFCQTLKGRVASTSTVLKILAYTFTAIVFIYNLRQTGVLILVYLSMFYVGSTFL